MLSNKTNLFNLIHVIHLTLLLNVLTCFYNTKYTYLSSVNSGLKMLFYGGLKMSFLAV